jgi:hypothetical protein
MGISWKSREVVRLENAEKVSALGRHWRDEIERLKNTMPRSGALDKAVDDAHVRCMSESLDALTDSYVEAYTTENQLLTASDIEDIVREMNERVQAMWRARAELEPRSIGLGFREALQQVVACQRQKLVLAKTRMERDRDLAARREELLRPSRGPIPDEVPANRPDTKGVTLDDVDALELKPNIFGIGINVNHLIKRFGAWRKRRREKNS